ncbi:unnamed protein product [Lepeophtheirus salmonis]|uniref:(salmon louse) hypothetical protein n=1 Tax=Lepeophtheirus salmonis TaxID=72036 RepID=A0A7R8D576_LEPSM|nr:unnamed protein product [Lepeophtheirus salmonis]CAF3033406.1 unnamed protein product [Lepeophtheirus salmonis]
MWESETTGNTSQSDKVTSQTVKFEKRVWPPVPNTEQSEKPMVPVKPTVKPPPPTSKPPKEPTVKPPPKPTVRLPANNIYAAPVGNNNKKDSFVQKEEESIPLDISKQCLLDYYSTNLESPLASISEGESISTLMQLSDKVESFHRSCGGYVDNIPATGRFRFRSLLSKLEQDSKELRNNKSSSPKIASDLSKH